VPRLSKKIYLELFDQEINKQKWPDIDQSLLAESEIELPIQINGKLVTTMKTIIDYSEEEQLALIYKNEKIKKRIEQKSIKKVINVKNKIINIIVN
jgi:leucyl-tRNA synthetase